MSLDSYSPNDDSELTDTESKILDMTFGESSDDDDDYGSSTHHDYYERDCYYDRSYFPIVIAIILTIIFFLLSCPSSDMFFSMHVPDPFFNWITRALIFFIIAFISLVIFEYYYYKPKHNHKK